MTHQESIQAIKQYIPSAEKSNLAVSKSTVAWQLDHSLKVLNGIALTLKKSDPKNFKPKFSIQKSIILFTGYIPRGKAKAPKEVNYKNDISIESLQEQVKQAEKLIQEVEKLPASSFFHHPFFGDLDLKTSLKFMGIHTKHHIKIIKDILK